MTKRMMSEAEANKLCDRIIALELVVRELARGVCDGETNQLRMYPLPLCSTCLVCKARIVLADVLAS